MENRQPKELTLSEIVKQVLKHKILIVAITIVIAIVGTIFIGVMPNKKNKHWVSTFQLTLAEDCGFDLPKNQTKNYKTIVSLENLNEVKADNEQYKDIDVEKIVEDGAVSISIDKEQVNLQTKIVYVEEYTIKVDSSYFANINVASKFVNDIIINAFDLTDTLELEKQAYYANYRELTDNNAKLDYIKNGLEKIIATYADAIAENGNVEVNGKTLLTYKQEIETCMANGEDAYKAEFTNFVDTYYNNVASFQKERIYVEYTDSVVLAEKGVRSLVVVAGASAILGVIAGCVVAFGIEYLKNQKEEKKTKEQENA